MNKCLNCGNETSREMFCSVCEDNNYHICENCGKVINKSTYNKNIGCLVCSECES
ncbi:MAG: hypothetical protein WC123_07665 [Bacilli bacterium]